MAAARNNGFVDLSEVVMGLRHRNKLRQSRRLRFDNLPREDQLRASRPGIRQTSRSAKEALFDDVVKSGITHRRIV